MAGLAGAVTGWEVTGGDIMAWGRDRLRLAREYNRRCGLVDTDDRLPDRFFDEPIDYGRHAGAVLDRAGFSAAIRRFRELSG